MLGFLDEYNKLSSYVHGGPVAEKFIFDDQIASTKEIDEIKAWAQSSLDAIKEHILIFLIYDDPTYIKLLKPIMDNRMKKYGAQHCSKA
jgi:hypothetical protein